MHNLKSIATICSRLYDYSLVEIVCYYNASQSDHALYLCLDENKGYSNGWSFYSFIFLIGLQGFNVH